MRRWALVAAAGVGVLAGAPAQGYFLEEPGYTLGRVLRESTNIVVLRVESVDRAKRTITYRKAGDLKGLDDRDRQVHSITSGFFPWEPKALMEWAEPGKTAVMFHNGSASLTCIGGLWYQSYPSAKGTWTMAHVDVQLARTFVGHAEDLADLVAGVLRGQEVAVPCVRFDQKGFAEIRRQITEKKFNLWHMRASAGITDYWAITKKPGDFTAEPPAADTSATGLARQWEALAGEEVGPALSTVWQLTAGGAPAAEFLKTRVRAAVKPVPPGAAGQVRIERLVADLDSDRFAAREAAYGELRKMGPTAVPALRSALAGSPTAEVRLRAEDLMAAAAAPCGEALRTLRAIRVLERVGGQPAREALAALAGGEPTAAETQAAKEAAARLDKAAGK